MRRIARSYDRLLNEALNSRFPQFGSYVVSRAWALQAASVKASKEKGYPPLSTEEKFYVYVIMDPRSRGPYTYRFFDKVLTLSHLPIYVGKGTGARDRKHVSAARRAEDSENTLKGNLLRKIMRCGLDPIVKRISQNDIESVAFAKEAFLIETIGIRIHGNGPLANLTYGGEGPTGHTQSESSKELKSKALIGISKSEETRRKMSASQLGNTKGRGNRGRRQSPEHLAALSAVRTGRKQSPETIAKRAAAHRGMKRPTSQCPHCGKIGAVMMRIYHFDNCKHKS